MMGKKTGNVFNCRAGVINSAGITSNRRSQGLPMQTIVVIILVLLVLAAVGYIFFVYFTGGASGFTQANTTVQQGIGNLTEKAGGI